MKTIQKGTGTKQRLLGAVTLGGNRSAFRVLIQDPTVAISGLFPELAGSSPSSQPPGGKAGHVPWCVHSCLVGLFWGQLQRNLLCSLAYFPAFPHLPFFFYFSS